MHDLSDLEKMPGVLPFEVYAQAPLRLISWCSFELNHTSKVLLRELAVLCELFLRKEINGGYRQESHFDRLGIALSVDAGSR
jgi:hypothetical protein